MNKFFKKIGKKTVSILYGVTYPPRFILDPSQDWEVCFIFDACRFDLFKKYNIFKGELEKAYSPGSSTREWFTNSFRGKFYPEITYISTNPYISNIEVKKRDGKIPFHEIIDLWRYGWSEKKGTVLPKIVNEVASNIIKKTERKVIIHYLQPHYPFIGEFMLETESMNALRDRIENIKTNNNQVLNPWEKTRDGLIKLPDIIKAYESNLEYVFNETYEFINSLEKNIIITSDHGNVYGKFWAYGHPPNLHIPELIEVPLLKINNI